MTTLNTSLNRPHRRSRRVVTLLTLIVALSGLDLLITLTHMRTIGMFEDNPVALLLIRLTGSTASLGFLKALSVLVAVALLYRLRRTRQAEIGSWVAVGILLVVSIQWLRYASVLAGIDPAMLQEIAALDAGWVRLG